METTPPSAPALLTHDPSDEPTLLADHDVRVALFKAMSVQHDVDDVLSEADIRWLAESFITHRIEVDRDTFPFVLTGLLNSQAFAVLRGDTVGMRPRWTSVAAVLRGQVPEESRKYYYNSHFILVEDLNQRDDLAEERSWWDEHSDLPDRRDLDAVSGGTLWAASAGGATRCSTSTPWTVSHGSGPDKRSGSSPASRRPNLSVSCHRRSTR